MTALKAITGFRLTTADPERLARFYTAIGFSMGRGLVIPQDEMTLLGLHGGGARLQLHLGPQQVDLDAFEIPGHPYPLASTASDRWFQHLAIVTSDAAAAWALAEAAGALPISRDGAVTLPQSSGGVTAVKFRDPEGHPLEFVQFPHGAAQGWPGKGILGIDHSAISVADAGRSHGFYTQLGLTCGSASVNHGAAQAALDGLEDVEVDVVPLLPPLNRPHLELLGYRTPAGRPAFPMEPNDIAATRILWAADVDALLRDPDGHLHLLRR